MSTPATRSLKATFDRILKPFRRDDNPDLISFVSGVNDVAAIGAIDDGEYGDPIRDTRPDFVRKDDATWL
jgi:hypothetical protein